MLNEFLHTFNKTMIFLYLQVTIKLKQTVKNSGNRNFHNI